MSHQHPAAVIRELAKAAPFDFAGFDDEQWRIDEDETRTFESTAERIGPASVHN